MERLSAETIVVGLATPLGRAICVGLATSGQKVVVVDDDLTLADQVAEGLRSIGASVRVDASGESIVALESLHRRRTVIDMRMVALDHEIGIVELADASAAMLTPGDAYVRVHQWSPNRAPMAAFDTCIALAEERRIGVVLIDVTGNTTGADSRFILESVLSASSDSAVSTVRIDVGRRIPPVRR